MQMQAGDESFIKMAFDQQNGNLNAGPKCPVVFYRRPVQNEAKSREAGRPIFEERDWIRKFTPGDLTQQIEREVRPEDANEYAEQYRQFKSNQEQTVDGTYLDKVPFLTSAQVAELKAVKVRTVEELVGMPDALASKFQGFQALKKRCTDFLEAAKGAAVHEKLRAELEKRDDEIEALKKALQQQGERISQLSKKG